MLSKYVSAANCLPVRLNAGSSAICLRCSLSYEFICVKFQNNRASCLLVMLKNQPKKLFTFADVIQRRVQHEGSSRSAQHHQLVQFVRFVAN